VTVPNRKVTAWQETPRSWVATLECGHRVGATYEPEKLFSVEEKEKAEHEGVVCYYCVELETEASALEMKVREAEAKAHAARSKVYVK
jgi:hypothetical protein